MPSRYASLPTVDLRTSSNAGTPKAKGALVFTFFNRPGAYNLGITAIRTGFVTDLSLVLTAYSASNASTSSRTSPRSSSYSYRFIIRPYFSYLTKYYVRLLARCSRLRRIFSIGIK